MNIHETVIQHFSNTAGKYDERNQQLAPTTDNMHFLMRIVLRHAPVSARVLCVGVGTGAEILSLAKAFPEWTFVAVDPAQGMLDVCRQRLADAGILSRCELVHGYVHDLPQGRGFDVALSILVAHFVRHEDRPGFYKAMCDRLRPQGILLNTEISFDLDSPEFPSMLRNWEVVQQLMGATAESIANLSKQLREMLTVIPPAETERILKASGIAVPVRFFQALMICGWYGTKGDS